MRHRAMLRGLFLLVAAAMLASCRSEECNVDAIADCYRQRIAQMPSSQRPSARPGVGATSQPASTQMASGLEPRQAPGGIVQLGLSDAIHRALRNSLQIKVESYSPGIAAADIIIAEAKFDTIFFVNPQFAHTDQGNNLLGVTGSGQTDSRSLQTGFRKQLITGGQVAVNYKANRLFQDQSGLRFNPSYDTAAALELRQPLLRGFGIDVNKAEIHITTNQRDISMYEFRRQVMETLANVEEAYWNLYLAREALAIGQELLARTERIFAAVQARSIWDAMPVQIAQTESALASRRAAVIRLAANVRTAEDQLKNLLNDPALPLNSDIALLPTTPPLTQVVEIDPQRELWIGLERRPELQQARLNIANTEIQLDVARNLQLPRLDLVGQWALNGLKGDLGNSTEQLLAGRLQDYIIGAELEVPIGNRGANAQVRKSKLQTDQAIATFQRAVSDVMTQIQIALREVQTSHREIIATRQAVEAATTNLEALIARRTGFTPDYLDLELRSQETQAEARRALVGAIANYNIAIMRLEQAKGTLLDYNQVQLEPGK